MSYRYMNILLQYYIVDVIIIPQNTLYFTIILKHNILLECNSSLNLKLCVIKTKCVYRLNKR